LETSSGGSRLLPLWTDVGAESHNRVEQADEKVLQAEQAKQQFMAYVFHNIRGDFAEAPKCQMILVSSLDC
jgi:hypothetical protein